MWRELFSARCSRNSVCSRGGWPRLLRVGVKTEWQNLTGLYRSGLLPVCPWIERPAPRQCARYWSGTLRLFALRAGFGRDKAVGAVVGDEQAVVFGGML